MKPDKLAYFILKSLEDHYLSSYEIVQKLTMNRVEFDRQKFYPTLSQLQLGNLLCYNWIKVNGNVPVKYYHLTRNGHHFIHQQY